MIKTILIKYGIEYHMKPTKRGGIVVVVMKAGDIRLPFTLTWNEYVFLLVSSGVINNVRNN